jgi:hypothetical protein
MAAFLSAANKTILDGAVVLSENSPIDHPADDVIAQKISLMHTALGYTSQIAIKEALRDRPFHTLLKAIQYLNANA